MWEIIRDFFMNQYERFDGFLGDTLDIDGRLLDLYNQFISPLPEIIKILGGLFVVVLLIFGTVSFVKKLLKLFVVIAVILIIVLAVTQLG